MSDNEILATISACGGTIAYSNFSGWLGNASGLGLNIGRVRKLEKAGKLVASSTMTTRRTTRSKALPIKVTAYRLV